MIDWPAPHHADPRMVEELKAIDPSAELLYLADGVWALVAKPEGVDLSRRKQTGRSMLRQMRQKGVSDPVTERSAMLIADGYGIVVQHRWEHGPTTDLISWFREADHTARTDFENAYDLREQESDGRAWEARMTARMREYNTTEGRSVYRHAYRNPVSFSAR